MRTSVRPLPPFEQDAPRAVGEDVPFRLRVGKMRDEDARRGFKRRSVEGEDKTVAELFSTQRRRGAEASWTGFTESAGFALMFVSNEDL